MDVLLQFEGPASYGWDANPLYMFTTNTLNIVEEIYMAKPEGWRRVNWGDIQTLINVAYQNGFKLIGDYKYFSELQMKYGVSVPYTVPKNLNIELKYEVKTTPKQCVHEFVDYTGFIEQFTYCRKCDVRK